jgi:putative ATP-dependent endonuclease of OLD family
MYLKQINIKKFRKYDDNDHIFLLAKGKSVKDEKENSKIDIASRTTLIIGKNNSGKSSLIEILNKVINGNFTENDFNYNYLKQWLENYRKITNNEEKINFLTPTIEMDIIVSLDDAADDIITNLVDFIDIEDIGDNDIEIKVKNELDNTIEFKNKLDEILKENIYEKDNFEKKCY